MMKNWIKYLFLIVIILGPLAYIIFFPASPANDILLKWVSSWPVFVLIAIFLFYEEIVKKIRELLKYEGPAGKAEWVGQKDVKEADTTKIEGEIKDLLIKSEEVVKAKEKKIAAVTGEKAGAAGAKEKQPKVDFDIFMKIRFFEVTIRYMFRSQFELLKHLSNVGSWPKAECYQLFYYQQYLKKFFGSEKYTFDQYLFWLTDTAMFVEETEVAKKKHLQLTERGKDFLNYCNSQAYTEFEFKPL